MQTGMIGIRSKFDPQTMLGVIDSLRRDLTGASPRGLKRGYDQAGTIYLQFLRRRYQRLSNGGGVWPRLKPSTVRQKHGDSRILIRSGRLYGSLLRGSPDSVFAVDAKGLTIGTMVPYAGFHQTGTSKMRRRAIYVRPDPQTRQLMQSRLTEAVNRAVNDAVAKAPQTKRPVAA